MATFQLAMEQSSEANQHGSDEVSASKELLSKWNLMFILATGLAEYT